MTHNFVPRKSANTISRRVRRSAAGSSVWATLALAASLAGCSSDTPSENTEPCTIDMYYRTNCSDPSTGVFVGDCATNDPNWRLSNCSDPNTAYCANPAGCGGMPAPTVTGLQPTVAPVSPTTTAPVSPTSGVSPQTSGVAPTVSPTGGVNPVTPVTPGVSPTGSSTESTAPVSPVSPTGSDTGTTSAPPVEAANRTCPAYEGLVLDFEEPGDFARRLVEAEGRVGLIDVNNDGSQEQVIEVVEEGSEACNNKVLHTSGSGFNVWGAGLETVFTGTYDDTEAGYVADPYDASALGYVGISFRAKKGSGQENPVKVNLTIPGTRGTENGGDGTCLEGEEGSDEGRVCWNHLGHMLIDDEELDTDWKTFTFCFQNDLHPTSLPTHLTPEQRATVGTNLMTLGFEFNKPDDPDDATKKEASFDFYVDDIKLVKSGCVTSSFESTDGAAHPFGSNSNIGTCEPADAAPFTNHQIGQAYLRWKRDFLRPDGSVFDPDQAEGAIVSEAIGYGMLITAAMGDKPAFDSIWGWAKPKMGGDTPSQLLGWKNGGDGSATDADTDMAYALLMADVQWPGGGYATAGNAIAALARQPGPTGVINSPSNILGAGNSYLNRLNPSYYSPGFYRAFAGDWSAVITATSEQLTKCQTTFGGLLPDWCTLDGVPDGGASAQVQAPEVCMAGTACAAFDAARVPWRLGYDVCTGGNSGSMLQGVMGEYLGHSSTQNGDRIDLLAAGWTANGPTASAVENAAALLGPVGVGAMGIGNREVLNRAYLTTLDIIERPEFYETYFQATVGLMALLTMSGNWPVVP